MLGNYFKPSSKMVLKVSLALKGFIGTISAATFFDGNKTAAFWFLIAGAFVDFILQCIDSDTEKTVKDNAGKITIIAVVMSLSCFSCATIRKSTTSEKIDSTSTEYKQVGVKLEGGSVKAAVNMDSIVSALRARLSGVARATPEFNVDSLIADALEAFKKEMKTMKPNVITDPESKVQLKYWVDQFGKLNIECSSKDQTIQMLVAELTRTRKEKTETIIQKGDPWYYKLIWGYTISLTLLLIIGLVNIIRKK